MNGGAVTPAEVRPRLAQVTADSVGEIQQALLDAALRATREHWTTFTCPDCGKKHRAQVQVADVRARVGAIEVLLREGLGRPPQSEEAPAPQLPASVEAVKSMPWDGMQGLFASIYLDEVEALLARGGRKLVAERLTALSDESRRVLRRALTEAVA
jgi:hypothetical protein